MGNSIPMVALAIGLLTAAPAALASSLADEANSRMCTGQLPLQLCFQPVLTLGDVGLVDVDPNSTDVPVGYAGIVRLALVTGVLEIPTASFDQNDLCAPYQLLQLPCSVVLSLPVSRPSPDPEVQPGLVLGTAKLGTLTVTLDGTPLLIVPSFVDVFCPPTTTPNSRLLDADCDGVDNAAEAADVDGDGSTNVGEILAGSNPFYPYSTPFDQGQGFPQDWDADGYTNIGETLAGSNPFQRCSIPSNPQGGLLSDCE